ncbi:MAG: SUMF1/EgtB/PvdO family nonheme iron enzyme [Thermoguttaceae bacterium]|jgi:formylglycine-generating enzyme required for sulfatase activity
MCHKLNQMVLAAAIVLTAGMVSANVFNMGPGLTSLEMVPVGDPGNAPNNLIMVPPSPSDSITYDGSVGYAYKIGKCEISAGQYTEFLNAVAGNSDPYGLYNSYMATTRAGGQITKSGSVYTAALPNQPANCISWGDAARFCNWMANGQPTTGVEDFSTTEDGSYYLNVTDWLAITRKPGATWFIPTEDEWYKAAYYDPNKGGPGVGGYWLWPTKSDDCPSNEYPSSGTNNANYNADTRSSGPPYTTEVGSFANSLSAYGTLDQGGNVWEWNETVFPEYSSRGVCGGGWWDPAPWFRADHHSWFGGGDNTGFRVAEVPEPGNITLLVCGAIAGLIWWRRQR